MYEATFISWFIVVGMLCVIAVVGEVIDHYRVP